MWMAMPHHRNDWSRLPNEDGILGALRSAGVGAGQYNFPHPPTREAMKDPAFIAKCEAGPMGHLIMAATLAYVGALPPASIWFNRIWGSIRREMFDGLVYGLLTAGVFGWLWP